MLQPGYFHSFKVALATPIAHGCSGWLSQLDRFVRLIEIGVPPVQESQILMALYARTQQCQREKRWADAGAGLSESQAFSSGPALLDCSLSSQRTSSQFTPWLDCFQMPPGIFSPFPSTGLTLLPSNSHPHPWKSVLSAEVSLWKPSNLGSHPKIVPRVTVKEKDRITSPAGLVRAKEKSGSPASDPLSPGVEELAGRSGAGLLSTVLCARAPAGSGPSSILRSRLSAVHVRPIAQINFGGSQLRARFQRY